MIVLDTNVFSELMRAAAAAPVLDWVVRIGWDQLRITSITRAEILSGICLLPQGRRRTGLELAANRIFGAGFAGPPLSFDEQAADHYADIVALRRRRGRSRSDLDMMIAAIARSHDAAVATRNLSDFEGCGVTLHDPWRG